MAGQAYVFSAKLVGYAGVTRTVAVRGDQRLTDLHAVLQQAFGWADDHLYSFWLTGRFWDRRDEYSHPFELEPGAGSAEVRLDRLRLQPGQRIAYLFDYGDEWRVLLTLAKVVDAEHAVYPAILASRGEAPPQYPPHEAGWSHEAA
jgi:hypothetical protein